MVLRNEKPLAWIIIVNWNGKADTLACLASLRKISYPSRHVLVVDNASADGSVEAIRAQFPEVE
ncbi:MAG: glycosyltransferase, partial [bacterium]